jgi:Rieske Fe-S protein
MKENCQEEKNCHNRREFLVKSTATAGGIVLSFAGLNNTLAQKNDPDDVTLKLDEKSPLSKVGDKIIVLRKSETEFKAYSAFCPHQGGVVFFNEKTNQFVCPLHNSKFDPDGQRLSGPARQPLSSFPIQSAIVVSLKL